MVSWVWSTTTNDVIVQSYYIGMVSWFFASLNAPLSETYVLYMHVKCKKHACICLRELTLNPNSEPLIIELT